MRTILTTSLIFCILLLPGLVKAQTISVSGKVTNAKGKALGNVSVFESKRNIGTITNKNGFFKLILTQGELNLKISESGFIDFSKEIVLSRDTIFTVKLEPVIQNQSATKNQAILSADAKTSKKHFGYRHFK